MTTMAYLAMLHNAFSQREVIPIRALITCIFAFAITQAEVHAATLPANFEPAFGVCSTRVSPNEEKQLRDDRKKYESLGAPLLAKQRGIKIPDSAQSKSIDAKQVYLNGSKRRVD